MMTYTPNLEGLLTEGADEPAALPGLVAGSWPLDEPDETYAVWGDGSSILWSEGEPLYLVGPPGAGKSTLAQQLVFARIGLRPGDLLGLPVKVDDRPVLYVAADRPRQAFRSARRMLATTDRDLLDAKLTWHRGPLPFSLSREPELLRAHAVAFGFGTVVIDSAKDMGGDLIEGSDATGFNMALQHLVAAGIEVLVLHHDRKGGGKSGGKSGAADLDDVYGSRYLTAGAGSVLTLSGDPCEGPVTLRQVKQPADRLGPFKVHMNTSTGDVSLHEQGDPLAILRRAPQGMAAGDLARHLEGVAEPSRAQVERARRQLDRLVASGKATRQDPLDRTAATLYRATA